MALDVLFVILLIGEALAKKTNTITIATKLGDIKGNVITDKAYTVYEFLGIQYGIPPVGNLRFRPAQLNTSWNTFIYSANTYGPSCIQSNTSNGTVVLPTGMNEDCLYLNIWTPKIDKTDLLPVMFWIHGGGFVRGTAADPPYDPINLITKGRGFVFVSINYRLSVLGFLPSQQLYDEDPNWKSYGGMNGIYDQIQALNWVKRFISDYGGDPNQITIFGESAGGISVCELIISPMVPKDTFKRAIVESGSCIGPWGPMETDQALRDADAMLIAHGMSTNITILRTYNASVFAFALWKQSVDALVMPEMPVDIYSKLNDKNVVFNTKKLIMGYNSMDGIIGYPFDAGPVPNTPIEYHEFVKHFVSNETQARLIETVYYPLSDYPAYNGHTNATLAWKSINGDVCVSCPTLQQMRQIIQQNLNDFNGFVYEFRGGSPYYSPHGAEIPFVFSHPSNESFFEVPWNETLSDQMVSSWTNFAKYGSPNCTLINDDIEWNEFGIAENVIIWDDNTRIESNYISKFRNGACDFWYNQVGMDVMKSVCNDGL